MSNLVFLRKFALRFVLCLAILGMPRMLLAETQEEDQSAVGGQFQSDPMTAFADALGTFLSGVDIQGCTTAVNSLGQMVNSSTGLPG